MPPQTPRQAPGAAPAGRTGFRPLTGGVVMSGASRVVAAGAAAATGIVVARMLGPSGTGRFAIAQALIALLTVATTLGVEHGIAYYVSAGRWSPEHANRDAQRVALVSGLLGAGAGVLARLAIPSAFGGLSLAATAVTAGALPFALSWFYISYVALAIDHYEGYVLPPALQATVGLALVALLAALYGLPGAVAGLAASHVATAVACGLAARRILRGASAHESAPARSELRRAIAFGIKGYAANALQFINYRLDLFILASVASSADVGHYAVAVAVTGVMWLLPQALSDVLFPRVAALSALAEDEGKEMRTMAETKSLRHTVIVVLVSSAALVLVLVFLVRPVYGAQFGAARDLGLILLPGTALLGVAGPMASTIVGRGRPGYSLAVTLVVTPVTVALYILLIPQLHASGAALASSISYALNFVLVTLFYRRVTGEPVLPRLLPTLGELSDYRGLAARFAARLRAPRPAR